MISVLVLSGMCLDPMFGGGEISAILLTLPQLWTCSLARHATSEYTSMVIQPNA